jgi:hypothetical protein
MVVPLAIYIYIHCCRISNIVIHITSTYYRKHIIAIYIYIVYIHCCRISNIVYDVTRCTQYKIGWRLQEKVIGNGKSKERQYNG